MEATSQLEYGILSLERDELRYQGGRGRAWSLNVRQLAVVGEYTNQSGPWGDDWFLVFVCRDSSQFFLAPVYANGIDSVRERLGRTLGAPLPATLANSAELSSVVLWPSSLAGSALMSFKAPLLSGFFARVRNALLPSVNAVLSPVVVAHARSVGT